MNLGPSLPSVGAPLKEQTAAGSTGESPASMVQTSGFGQSCNGPSDFEIHQAEEFIPPYCCDECLWTDLTKPNRRTCR